MPSIDLHSHSYYSDGELSPTMLVSLACEHGVDILALTDHDNTAGVAEALTRAQQLGLTLIPGVEISVSWQHGDIHLVGLNIDPDCSLLQQGLAEQLVRRSTRAQAIAAKLEQLGVDDAYAGVQAIAGNQAIGRLHFAKLLLARGCVKDVRAAFHRYLANDKPGYVATTWVGLKDAIAWIKAANGQAVLAHPSVYPFTKQQLCLLLQDFKAAGGVGLEVVTSNNNTEKMQQMARLGRDFGLLASLGSDFHGPSLGKRKLGNLPALPPICQPIWYDWKITSKA